MKVCYIEFVDFNDGASCVLFQNGFGQYELPELDYLKHLQNRLTQTINYHEELRQYGSKQNVRLADEEATKREEWVLSRSQNRSDDLRWVYLIKNEDRDIYKVGVSLNPKHRLRQLQSVTTDKLTLMVRIKGGYKLEKELHDKYNNLNLSGEWFSPCFELINEFSTIK